MKDLSFFLLKNTLGAKMKKGIRSFCNGDGSTSTLNQHKTDLQGDSPFLDNNANYLAESPPTLEEMILQLELEEETARKAKLHDYGRRMSCVNNSDILRSARNALNQYPRFSLDGKDAMYRSSFQNLVPISTAGRKSICCNRGLRDRFDKIGFDSKLEKSKSVCLPPTLGGESVTWCKPGVVAKLMGLEAMPVPISSNRSRERFMRSITKKQNVRRMAERHDMERRRLVMDINGCGGINRGSVGSCSKTGYCVMKPIAVEPVDGGADWPTRRFL